MSPLTAIPPQALSAYGIRPRADVGPAEITLPAELEKAGGITATPPTGETFSTLLGHFVQDVNTKQNAAGDAVARLQSGGDISLHDTVIAMEEANVSFQLMVEVRNKLLESYQELMRMQV